MSDTKNRIALNNEHYKLLLETYKDLEKEPMNQFVHCYETIDKMKYIDIHFIITSLKAFETASSLPFAGELVDATLQPILDLIGCVQNDKGRRAFLLDLLEEARERKRSEA